MCGLRSSFSRVSGSTRINGSSCGVQDERGNGDAIHHAGRGRARVVILGIAKAGIARRDLVVEIAQAAQAAKIAHIVAPGIKRGFAEHAPPQPAQKLPLVEPVGALVQRIG